MALSHYQIALVQKSLGDLRAALPPGDTRFYDRLFAEHPEYRAFFRDDLAGQGMRFMSTLEAVVQHLNAPDELTEHLARLADNHAAMRIRASYYAPMGDALFATFRDVLGPSFTKETEDAWRDAYAMIAARMMDRAPS